eukprot:857300_1
MSIPSNFRYRLQSWPKFVTTSIGPRLVHGNRSTYRGIKIYFVNIHNRVGYRCIHEQISCKCQQRIQVYIYSMQRQAEKKREHPIDPNTNQQNLQKGNTNDVTKAKKQKAKASIVFYLYCMSDIL